MNYKDLQSRLKELENKKQAEFAQRYFKTGPGEYGEGDKFLGIRVPVLRKIAKGFKLLPLLEVQKLLKSPFHEERFVALQILVQQYQKGDHATKDTIYDLYLANTKYINNWDLIDTTAHKIIGEHLFQQNKAPLYRLVRSGKLWERRIGIMASAYYINRGEFGETLKLAEILLKDTEDLIHKAVGWMLREVGKRNIAAEEDFLKRHYKTMPRTMLRYAIEKFPEFKRQAYLKGNI